MSREVSCASSGSLKMRRISSGDSADDAPGSGRARDELRVGQHPRARRARQGRGDEQREQREGARETQATRRPHQVTRAGERA